MRQRNPPSITLSYRRPRYARYGCGGPPRSEAQRALHWAAGEDGPRNGKQSHAVAELHLLEIAQERVLAIGCLQPEVVIRGNRRVGQRSQFRHGHSTWLYSI